jgi:hypothetical protein
MILGSWFNREKVCFFGCAGIALIFAVKGAVAVPSLPSVGEHRSKIKVPGVLVAHLQKPGKQDLRKALVGDRQNPFTAYVRRSTGGTTTIKPKDPRPIPHPPVFVPPPPIPIPPVSVPRRPVPDRSPKAYQVPVSFVGVSRVKGRPAVYLKVKSTGEDRVLHDGDIWPDTGLTIVKITFTSVLLENEKKDQFLMRDLYARKKLDDD